MAENTQVEQNKQEEDKVTDLSSLLKIYEKVGKRINEGLKEENEKRFVYDESSEIELNNEIVNKVEKIRKQIKENGYRVEVTEDIDSVDVSSKSKFNIRIYDLDGCFVEFDLFKYREIELTYTESEQAFIEEQLTKISGVGIKNIAEISDLICEYLSYICYFNELQTKIYSEIGWSVYNNKRIFKYDVIYQNDRENEKIISRCTNDLANDLHIRNSERFLESNDKSEEAKSEEAKNEEAENEEKKSVEEKSVEEKIKDLERNTNGWDTYEWVIKFDKIWRYDAIDILDLENKTMMPYNALIISAACTGLIRPLLPYTKENNINMNIVGKRASGKSTICHFALSLFGNPEQLEGSFIDSEEAAEIIRVKRPVIPYILDERMLKVEDESDKKKRQTILMNIFREYEGKVKERMAGANRELSGQRTYAPVISTSVEPMMNLLLQTGRDLGQYRRFIELTIHPRVTFMDSDMAQTAEELAYSKYGFGVEIIVQYILDNYFSEMAGKNALLKDYNTILDYVNKILKEREEREVSQGNTSAKGIDSSAKRFALILTSSYIIESAMLYFLINFKDQLIFKSYSEAMKKEYEELVKLYGKENIDRENIVNSRMKDILNILVENLVEKMKKIDFKTEIFDNLKNFYEKHKSLFAEKENDYNGDYNKYLGYYIKDGEEEEFGFRYKRGFEWIAASGLITLSNEQIMDYVKRANKKSIKDKNLSTLISGEIGDFALASLESALSANDKNRVIITTKTSTSIKGTIVIRLKNVKTDGEGLTDSDKAEK